MPLAWVIEDNDLNFELIEFLLEEEGWSVARAADGAAAELLFAGAAPDVVLLDMNLPDVSGLELAARIRTLPHLDGVRLVAITAHAMRGDRERFLAGGCDAYVAKPIDRAALAAELAAATAEGER